MLVAVLHAAQLVTLAGVKRPRVGGEMGELSIIRDGAMLVQDDRIVKTGPSDEIEKALPDHKDARTLHLKDLEGKKNVVLYFFPKALTGG